MKQLLREKEGSDPKGWAHTQQQIQTAKLQRTRLTREIVDLKAAILQADVDVAPGTISSRLPFAPYLSVYDLNDVNFPFALKHDRCSKLNCARCNTAL